MCCHLVFSSTLASTKVLSVHTCTYQLPFQGIWTGSDRKEVQRFFGMFGSEVTLLSSLPHDILQTLVLTRARQLGIAPAMIS